MCGIFGQITDDVSNVNLDKIKILGILNETRGTTSCGVAIDDDILIGFTGTESTFRNFAHKLENPIVTPYVIGHTRKASPGMGATADNAHPFGFGTNEKTKGFEFIGAHNGTLYNHEEIANLYNIPLTAPRENPEWHPRTKIDSEVFLEAIQKDLGNFKVFEHYDGGAAVVFADTVTNKVYFYSGKSKQYDTAATLPTEERPLHVWVQEVNSIFFSSEKGPLLAIGGTDDTVFQIDYNTVYEFTPGKFAEAKKYPVDRANRLQRKKYETTTHQATPASRYGGMHGWDDYDDDYPPNQERTQTVSASRTTTTESRTSTGGEANKEESKGQETVAEDYDFTKRVRSIFHRYENTPLEKIDRYGSRPYYLGLRMYAKNPNTNGSIASPCTGVYLLIPTYGYVYLGKNTVDAFDCYNSFKNHYIHIGKNNKLCTMKEVEGEERRFLIKIFRESKEYPNSLDMSKLAYFYKGIRVLAGLDLHYCYTHNVIEDSDFVLKMSHMSVYPIQGLTGCFYKEGKAFTGEVKGADLEYCYEFKNGTCTKSIVKEHQSFLGFMNLKVDYLQFLVRKNQKFEQSQLMFDAHERIDQMIELKEELGSAIANPFQLEEYEEETTDLIIKDQSDELFIANLEKKDVNKTAEVRIKESLMIDISATIIHGYQKYIINSDLSKDENPATRFWDLVEETICELSHKELKYYMDYFKSRKNEETENKVLNDVFTLLASYFDYN